MGWRFQQRINLFPGVRLNLSGSGLSVTIGAPGASVNLGPRGTYLNVGVPGSGVSYRTRLDAPQGRPARPLAPVPASPGLRRQDRYDAPAGPAEAIHSAAVHQLTSGDLADLKRLILDAEATRARLLAEVEATDRRRQHAQRRLAVSSVFLVRLLTFWTWPAQRRRLAVEEAAHREACGQLERCRIDLDFAFDEPTFQSFAQVEQAFAGLAQAARIWDVTSQAATDRVTQRTTATRSVERTPVAFHFGRSPVLGTGRDALVLGNANGEDLFIYPAFVMLHERGGDIALVDLRSLALTCQGTSFIEEEGVPGDAQVIGQTWKRTNKDGSPDRRFRDNYQIPVARYARLELGSPTGLHEAYLVSRADAAASFAAAMHEFQRALRTATSASRADAPPALPPPDDAAGPAGQPLYQPLPEPRRPRWFPFADLGLVTLLALVLLGAYEPRAVDDEQGRTPAAEQPSPAIAPLVEPAAPQGPEPRAEVGGDGTATLPQERVVVRVIAANVRAEPGRNARIVGSVHSGDVLVVLGREADWIHVGRNGPLGWVHRDLLTPAAP